jgi:hypothetical protein
VAILKGFGCPISLELMSLCSAKRSDKASILNGSVSSAKVETKAVMFADRVVLKRVE